MKSLGSRVPVENNRVPGAWGHPDIDVQEATRTVTVELPVLQCPTCRQKWYPVGEDAPAVVAEYEHHTCWPMELPARPVDADGDVVEGEAVADGGDEQP